MGFKKWWVPLLLTLTISACGEQKQAEVVRYSHPQVCEFADAMAALDATQPDPKQLRFLNESWRSLKNDELFRPAEAPIAAQRMTKLNYYLAQDTLQLLDEVLALTAATYEEIEALRRFSSNPKEMKVPESMIRNYRNAVQACCADALSRNATALVRADKESGLYAVGRRAYFMQRDVNALLDNEMSFADYREKLGAARAKLPASAPQLNLASDWVTCR
ncbi:hypothetical protein [Pseudidiomarina insulisalsae]|uniref:Uncharacterized protein n=1 Tax=Pseudidiomarina insulisalsae TaxID=575789 RepID=A0A432YPQ2_9GAMM|nr:hypothetical protein [Pseudidiomarina insulisalsae]RUO63055.1 hypothetical protein CWI71_02170 [Pseudidiomarina insulisalsae]